MFSIIPVSAYDDEITEQEFLDMMAAQRYALEANKILMDHIVTDTDKYPDYYGGVYIEDNILHIQLTETSTEVAKKIESLLNKYKDYISIDKVDYSYNTLYNYAHDTADSLCAATELYEITGFYVDIVGNSSVITVVSKEVATKLTKVLSEKENTIPLKIKIDSSVISRGNDDNNTLTRSSQTQTRTAITLKGGMPITNTTKWFTLGFCGTSGSQKAFVTCGHDQNASAWTHTGTDDAIGPTIGGPSYIRHQNYGNGDFSIHLIASDLADSITLTNKIQNVSDSGTDISVTGIYADPSVGTYIFKYNATPVLNTAPRYRSYCCVDQVGVTKMDEYYVYLSNMTVAILVSEAGTSAKGDSGGPYFTYSNGAWSIAGVACGHLIDQNDNITGVMFTPWKYISAAGFSAKLS